MADSDPEKGAVDPGRGVLYIAAAKMYFMLAGAAIEFVLPRLLGPGVAGRALFGAYGFVVQSASNVNNVVVTGTIQAVSRYTAQDATRSEQVKAAGLRMYLMVGLPIALVFALAVPLWAHFVHDPGKVLPLLLSAMVIAAYACYSVFTGSANGTRRFHQQAGLDVGFSSLRALFVLGAAGLGLGVVGAVAGWVVAAVLILIVAVWWVGWPHNAKPDAVGPMAAFLGILAVYLFLFNLFMSTDLFLLKRLSAEWFLHHGSAVGAAATLSDEQVGLYRAVQNLARLPYQLMIAATFVVFPLISRATFLQDAERTRSYVRTTLRYSLIVAGAMGTVLAANPGPVLDLPYAPEYARQGAAALIPLALGHVAFAIFAIGGAILNAAGRTRDTIVLTAVVLAVLAGALYVAIPTASPGSEMLFACGAATGGAMLLGALGVGVLLYRRLGAFVPWLTAVRVLFAVGATLFVGRLIPATRPLATLAELAVCGLTFLAVLIGLRELGRADLAAIASIGRKQRAR